MATSAVRWTSADLDLLPEDGKRYEVVNGELEVSRQPSWNHQLIALRIGAELDAWSLRTGAGLANAAPGVILAAGDDVAPDVVWVSTARLARVLDADGKLHGAPDLVVEVLSPGMKNEQRDHEAKLKAYSRHGVDEYWIVDGRLRHVQVYRRQQAALALVATLRDEDQITSPLLPGFSAQVARFFAGMQPSGDAPASER